MKTKYIISVIHKIDAHYSNRKKYIGKRINKNNLTKRTEVKYKGYYFYDGRVGNKTLCFYAIKFKKVTK